MSKRTKESKLNSLKNHYDIDYGDENLNKLKDALFAEKYEEAEDIFKDIFDDGNDSDDQRLNSFIHNPKFRAFLNFLNKVYKKIDNNDIKGYINQFSDTFGKDFSIRNRIISDVFSLSSDDICKADYKQLSDTLFEANKFDIKATKYIFKCLKDGLKDKPQEYMIKTSSIFDIIDKTLEDSMKVCEGFFLVKYNYQNKFKIDRKDRGQFNDNYLSYKKFEKRLKRKNEKEKNI